MTTFYRDVATPLAVPKLYHDKYLKCAVVGSRNLALATGHRHDNIVHAARRARADKPELTGEFREWNDNSEGGRKVRPRVVMTRTGLIATFGKMRKMRGHLDMTAIMNDYLRLFDAREAAEAADIPPWAEPAPDTEVRPPETPDMFKAFEAATDNLPSWQINAALMLLRRTTLPKEIRVKVEEWNTRRCDALHAAMSAAGAAFDQLRAIYATEDPDKA